MYKMVSQFSVKREIFACSKMATSIPMSACTLTIMYCAAATFVSLLLEVESTYEVHDYIRSFLGETDEVHAFAKLFLEKRQRLKRNQQQKTHQVCVRMCV